MKVHPETDADISREVITTDIASFEVLKELQGECRIEKIELLKISWLKTILLIIPIIVTVFPLLLLKYFKKLRVMAFYAPSLITEATHVYI